MNTDNTKHNSICLQKAWDDEPIFVILGRDTSAAMTVMEWIKLNVGIQPSEKLFEALSIAEEMIKFYNENWQGFAERKQGTAPKDSLNAAEALYGFVAWLTTRKHTLFLGAAHDAAPSVPLIQQFIQANGLAQTREDWQKKLIPVIEAAVDQLLPIKEEDGMLVTDKVLDAFDTWAVEKFTFEYGSWWSVEDKEGDNPLTTIDVMKMFRENAIGEVQDQEVGKGYSK